MKLCSDSPMELRVLLGIENGGSLRSGASFPSLHSGRHSALDVSVVRANLQNDDGSRQVTQ